MKKKLKLKPEYLNKVIFFRGHGVFPASEVVGALAERISKDHPQYFTHEQNKEKGAEIVEGD